MNLSKTILSDPINKWVLSKAETEIFLVGGYIRDLLRGHISKDKDYVLETNVKEIATATAKKFNGTFIILKKNYTYRVALKDKQFIDFTYLREPIEENLRQRDFTIDAIAWSPKTGIVDPFKGSKDLKNKLIKVVMPKNLANDPLRVLRAYRLAAQLGFSIEENTRRYLRDYADGLVTVAPERITEELFKILNNRNAGYYLKACYKDKVLEKIFRLDPGKLRKNLKLFTRFNTLQPYTSKKTNQLLNTEISQGLTRAGLIRLALLLMSGYHLIHKNKPLRLSRVIKKALRNIHNGCIMAKGKITDKKLYEIFKEANDHVFEMAIVLSIIREKDKRKILERAKQFIKVKNKILLTGDEVQKILNITPGVLIGRVLSALQEQQFYGILKTKAEARAWVLSNFT
jgi:tRNA nucleotidyltransferase/poly(A) polymerase